MRANKIFCVAFIVSLLLHIAVAILLFVLIQKYQDSTPLQQEKKVKISFKKGGDSAKKDSQFKENTPIPKTQSQPIDTPINQTEQILPKPTQSTQSTQSTKPAQSMPNTSIAIPSNPSHQLNLENLQIYQPPQQPTPPSQNNLSYTLSRIPSDTREEIMSLYGDELGDYGDAERDFIVNNLRDIGRITQYHLSLRGYPPDAGYLGQQGENAVEFFLYPNGDISDLEIIEGKSSKSMILDKNTIKTIQIAFKDYPRPTTKTKIKIYVRYYLISKF